MAATNPAPMSRAVAVLYAIGSPLMLIALVFVPAGRIDWLPGWVFIGIVTAVFVTSAVVLEWVNPVIYRARSRFQPGTKRWDLVLVPIILAAMVLEVPLAALDSGRMLWSAVPLWMVLFGYVLLVGGIAVTTWAQAFNPFFEPGVRIQHERGQRVVSSGPYAFIRHPGYTAAIAMFLGLALALASWWALIPAALASGLLVLRTSWEDQLLEAELSGYSDYARRIRFRLVPGLW